jgi:tetratricopeptide (TPR) repeat protein
MNAASPPTGEPTPQGKEASPIRLAVFKTSGERKEHLATLTLKKGDADAWTIEAGGPSVEGLAPLLQQFSATPRAGPSASPADALAQLLTSEGYSVERLPDGDHQVQFQIDLKTGSVVGTHAPMHELAPQDDIGRRVFEAIAGGLSKFADELADEIDKRMAGGDNEGIAAEVKRGLDQGLFGLKLTRRLMDALMRVDVAALSPTDRRIVRDGRLVTAQQLRRFDIAGAEADFIISEDTGTLTPEQIATLRMTSALGALRRGRRETALMIWRELLKDPSHLGAEGRGWALRNISHTLPDDDPEALRDAQLSSDAFLEAGNKIEAGQSLMRVANILMNTEPREAVKKLNEMVAVLEKEGLLDRRIRGAALQARANRLAKLHQHEDAFRDAVEAVEMRRGLLGAEGELISSLHLAALEARIGGDTEKADAYATEAESLTAKLKIPHFQLAERVTALVTAFDAKAAGDLVRDAEAAGNLEIVAAVRVIEATMDQSLTDMQRLERLEETYTNLNVGGAAEPLLHPVSLGLAKQLIKMGQFQRAVEWLRKILTRDPLDNLASVDLVNCLWKIEKWGDAAIFIKRQLDLRGEHPVMLYAYGRSLFESGDFSGAINALTRSLTLAQGNRQLKARVRKLRDRAYELVGAIVPARPPKPDDAPITRPEFEAALDAFGKAVSAMRRMAFWGKKRNDGQRPWTEKPERKAQDLLHMYLQAKFGQRVEPFEEIVAGAGRIDLYLKFAGGLSIVVEIKMCGGSYSSAYAAAGEQQLTHYMENKGTKLGYLLVFDGRTRDFGKRVLSGRRSGFTVIERFVDVRPRVGRKKAKRSKT